MGKSANPQHANVGAMSGTVKLGHDANSSRTPLPSKAVPHPSEKGSKDTGRGC